MRRFILIGTCSLLLAVAFSRSASALVTMSAAEPTRPAAAAQPERKPESSSPPWNRTLSGEAAARVEQWERQIEQLQREGRFDEAIEPAREVAEIRTRLQGADHWQTADARRAVADLRTIAALPEEGRKALASVEELDQKMVVEHQHARLAEAERISRLLLEIRRKWLGRGHPDTAQSCNNVGYLLDQQAKHAQAEPLHREALAINLKALGENHPHSAITYNNLARNLDVQGKSGEAEPLHRKALEITLQSLGEDHPDTARSENNLAINLDEQGRHAEAEPLHRKALAIRLKALGEDHPDTATGENNLALNLLYQGKYAEAEPLLRQALAIQLKVLGESNPGTANSYNSLAANLDHQGRHAEAEPLYRQALAIWLKAAGEGHPDTATSYNNLAAHLERQRKWAEAEPLYRQALALRRKSLGEGHPDTATSENNLAFNLDALGKPVEAEPLYRRALAIRVKAVGSDHPLTVQNYYNLAFNLDAQAKPDDALSCWTTAAAIYERIRGARSASGLERSVTPLGSPLPALAIALARQGQAREAWTRWEADLARGLLDDLSARLLRPLTREQHRREADLAGQLQRLDERVIRLEAQAQRTQEEDNQLKTLHNERSILRGQWVEFQNVMDREYQAFAGKPSSLEEVQKALPADAALVGWLDVAKHRWTCMVRHEGEPIWVKITGSGPAGTWTKEDDERPGTLRDALAGNQPAWGAPAEILARQRLAPLGPLLKGVKHLIVLPSHGLAGVPIEALVAALPAGSPRPVVSYAPSGTMFARLSAPRSQPPGPPRLLALGDPAFPQPAPSGSAPPPPGHGIAILAVVPHSTADLFNIKPGDVLLEYNGKVLNSQRDLAVVPVGDHPIRVPIKLWRDGEVRSLEIAAGRLGIQSNPNQPAAQAVLAQRAATEVLHPKVRGGTLSPLPGTRREIQAIAALFPNDQVTTLMGPEATESKLQHLAQSGALKGFRFLHLATHGQANPSVALSSAVFLAAEPDRPTAPADPAALEAVPDGQITAEQIVRTWDLDTDLVVLSACESGLGRYAGGEGYLGFAQALFVKGARSLVLSQWKVDDVATALLMERFYQNLLGRRAGLSQPMPKAEALEEAKRWLRELTEGEAARLVAAWPAADRGQKTTRPQPPRPRATPAPMPQERRPYAHPYFWAAFILVGSPD